MNRRGAVNFVNAFTYAKPACNQQHCQQWDGGNGVGAVRVVKRHQYQHAEQEQQGEPWLSADCETPSCAAARVKLRSRATTIKEIRSLKLSFNITAYPIYELHS